MFIYICIYIYIYVYIHILQDTLKRQCDVMAKTTVWGLKLVVYEAFSYALRVLEALNY